MASVLGGVQLMGRPSSCNPCCNAPNSLWKLDGATGSVLWERPHKLGMAGGLALPFLSVGVDSLGQIVAVGDYSNSSINTRSFSSAGSRLWSIGVGASDLEYVHAGLNGKIYVVGDPAFFPAYNKVKELNTSGAVTATITTTYDAIACVADAGGLLTVFTRSSGGAQTLEQWDTGTGLQTWSISLTGTFLEMAAGTSGEVYVRELVSPGLDETYTQYDSAGSLVWSYRVGFTGAADETGNPGPMAVASSGDLCVIRYGYTATAYYWYLDTLDAATGVVSSTAGPVPLPADPSIPPQPTAMATAYVSYFSKARIDSLGNVFALGREILQPTVGVPAYRYYDLFKADSSLSQLWSFRSRASSGYGVIHDLTIDASDNPIIVGEPGY